MSFFIKREETNTHNLIKLFGIVKLKYKKKEFVQKQKESDLYYYKKNNIDITKVPPAKGLFRDIQLANLKLLKELDYVCKNNGLTYWLDFGTLLGAVRHKGYIPWDDDIDTGMIRDDYEKLINCFNTTTRNPDIYAQYFRSSIHKTNYYIKIKHKKCPNLFVDIFPYDFYGKTLNDKEKLKETKKIKNLRRNFEKKYVPVEDNEEVRKGLKYLRNLILADSANYNEDLVWGCDYHHHWGNWFSSNGTIFPLKEIEFEGIKFPCINNPDKYLKSVFGDYMKYPKKIKLGHIWDTTITAEEVENLKTVLKL